MKRSARRTRRARRDVLEAAKFIARDSVDSAMRFFDAVDDAIGKLAEMPGMGRLREFDNPMSTTSDLGRSGDSRTTSCSTARRHGASK